MSLKDLNAALKKWAEQPKNAATLDRALYGLGGRDWPVERIAARDGDLGRLRAAVERQDPPPPPPPPGTVRCHRCRVVTGCWHTVGDRDLCPACDLAEEAKR